MKKFIKRYLVVILTILIQFYPNNFNKTFADDIGLSAKSAILICADSGDIIYSKNEKESMPMASTTKIMTSILAIENIEACGNREIEITDEMVRVEGTSMGLMPGDVVNLETLVKGMLLCSGNDAANATAISISGNPQDFSNLMNEKAKLLGMNNTHFVTPSGLDKDNHHSCAYDMAILGAYAMENEKFRDIASKKSMQITFINPKKTVSIRNHNKLLRLYEGCIGIKTGFTKLSGRCLVSCAEKNGIRLVAVTLNAHSDWDDHINLYNYGFGKVSEKVFDDRNFKVTIPIKNGELETLNLVGATYFSSTFKNGDESKIERVVDIPELVNAPIEQGQIIGKVVYYLNGKLIGQNDIISESSVDAKIETKNIFQKIIEFFKNLLGK